MSSEISQAGDGRERGGGAAELDEALFRRLVLANQYEILALLDPESADHHRRNARLLREWWPVELVPEIAAAQESREDPLTREDVLFVIDILELFRDLQDAEAKGLRAAGGPGTLAFPGFCGNHELNLLSFYEDTRERGLFGSLRLANPRDLNSHWPMAPFYRRMVAKWDEFGRPHDLDEAQFQAIAAAWDDPDDVEAAAG